MHWLKLRMFRASYAFAIATVLRFVPVFASEMNHIMEAQDGETNGVEFDTKNPLKKLQLTMPLIVPLLVSSVKKKKLMLQHLRLSSEVSI